MALPGFLAGRRGSAQEFLPVGSGPSVRAGAPPDRPLIAGGHLLDQQLKGALGGLWVGPVVAEHQKRAESSRLLPQPVDQSGRVVGRADDREAAVHHGSDEFVPVVGVGGARQGYHLPEVAHPRLDAVLDVFEGLLGGLGNMDRRHDTPLGPVGGVAVLLGLHVPDVPVGAQRLETCVGGGAHRQHRPTELPGAAGAVGRHRGGHADVEQRVGVGRELQAGLAELEPVGLHGEGLVGAQQMADGLQGLLHPGPGLFGVHAHHVGVGRQSAGAHAEHHPSLGEVVEQHHALGHLEGGVVGHRHHAGAQLDAAGPLGGRRDHQVGRGDDLPAAGVVLSEPVLVEAKVVEPLAQVQIPLELQGRILPMGVERRLEQAEPQSSMHEARG